MKTPIPNAITSIEEAKAWLKALHANDESFHPEDDAHDIINGRTGQPFCTPEQADKINTLTDQMYALSGVPKSWDPCGYIIDLGKDFFIEDRSGRGNHSTVNAITIRENWDLSAHDSNTDLSLEEFLETCEIGDEWNNDEEPTEIVKRIR